MSDLHKDQKTYLFLSDAHLGGFSKEKNRQIEDDLIALVEFCRLKEIRIAVLGDLFDYWMEYPDRVPRLGRKLLDRFEKYNRLLGPAIYVTGNHDNWTRDHFSNRGFKVTGEQKILTIGGKKIMLLHGDGLRNPQFNLPRPLMHRLLRNSRFIKLYQRLLPPSAGIKLMKYFSRFTRWMDQQKDKQKKLNKWAENELKTKDVDVIVCGHDHIPRIEKFNFGTFLNLGNFCHSRTVGLYNNGIFSLVVWNGIDHKLTSFGEPNDEIISYKKNE